MIDVTKIDDVKKLQEMKDDLNFFINKKIVADIYDQKKKSEELEEDRRLARELLDQILLRLSSIEEKNPAGGT